MKTKFKKILILGSGALQIGQAGEFDYSGSQAIKALKEEKIKVILINPNIATFQTSNELADQVYFLPINEYFVEKIIAKDKPDGIMISFGGQTALNCGLKLHENGILKKYNVEVLGSPISAIKLTEDRELFAKHLKNIALPVPLSAIKLTEDRELFAKHLKNIALPVPPSGVATNLQDGVEIAKTIGYPVMVRAGFLLGGQRSGVAKNKIELKKIINNALSISPHVLIEKYLYHFKEIEYEVVRDSYGNTITVCNMENVDPMGIHTGDSMVVAPSQTLNNNEYHTLRAASIKIINSLKIIGECNVQFALNPSPHNLGNKDNREIEYFVIEVNARLSRSSALASKATGYPLAYVAAKLAIGKNLLEIKNKITMVTQSFFEPALDYVVMKMPRWDLEKFQGAEKNIGSAMKSVGEVMAIGRTFEEALQKAIRMQTGLNESITDNGFSNEKELKSFLNMPTPKRIFAIAEALKRNISVSSIYKITGIDPWFLYRIKNIVNIEKNINSNSKNIKNIKNIKNCGIEDIKHISILLLEAKQNGFSDKKIGQLVGETEFQIRKLRKRFGIMPSVFSIDTLAGEVPAKTNYLYLTYNGSHNDVKPIGKNSILVLGSGPYHIGSSVEFDWSSVHTAIALKTYNKKSIVINCNPETVSTDYDMSDRLYFENISFETVSDIFEFENSGGIIISMGGQRPNNLARKLSREGFNILGTSSENIHRAENRNLFSELLDKLNIDQPQWSSFTSMNKAKKFSKDVGFPVLVRPSYVLSGAAMKVCYNIEQLINFTNKASILSPEFPVTISKYIENAKELEFDAVAQNGKIVIYGISEHIENAGVHSGDATIVYPTQRVYSSTEFQIQEIAKKISKELNITGPFNIQFLIKENKPFVIEVNIRASRTFPFISKGMRINFPKISVDAFFGKSKMHILKYPKNVTVKAPQFSFSQLLGADPVLRVEMSSTGEVACFGKDYDEALLKAILSSNKLNLNRKTALISLGGSVNKVKFLEATKELKKRGYKIFATDTTAKFLIQQGIPVKVVGKVNESHPNVIDIILKKQISFAVILSDYLVPESKGKIKRKISDNFLIRRAAVDNQILLLTDLNLSRAFVKALVNYQLNDLEIKSY